MQKSVSFGGGGVGNIYIYTVYTQIPLKNEIGRSLGGVDHIYIYSKVHRLPEPFDAA